MKDEKTPNQEAVIETAETNKKETPVVESVVETPNDDRSAFNCVPCKGDGLVGTVGNETRCTNCGGTGKV